MANTNFPAKKDPISIKLDENTEIRVIPIEANDSYSQVSQGFAGASKVFDGITKLSQKLKLVLEDANPDEASVEFSIGFSAKSSELIAILVDAGMEGSIKVTLTWKK
jgi:hypothetical protein